MCEADGPCENGARTRSSNHKKNACGSRRSAQSVPRASNGRRGSTHFPPHIDEYDSHST